MGGGRATARKTMSQQNSEIELEFWRSIKDSGKPEKFQRFLECFPGGNYSDLARRKMSKLAAVGVPATAASMAVGAEDADASFASKLAEQEQRVRRLKADQKCRLAEAARERELQLQLQREEAQRQEQARAAALAQIRAQQRAAAEAMRIEAAEEAARAQAAKREAAADAHAACLKAAEESARRSKAAADDAAKAAAAENVRLEARAAEQARQQEPAEEQARRAEQIAQRELHAVVAAPERTVTSAGIASGQGAPRPVDAPSKAPLIIGGAVALLVLVGAGVMLTSANDVVAPAEYVPALVAPAASASAAASVSAVAPPVCLPKASVQAESQNADGPIRPDPEAAAKTKDAASLAATQANATQAKTLAGQQTLDDASKAVAARDDKAKKSASDQARARAKADAAIAAAKKSASDQARARDETAAKAARDLADQKAKDEDAAKKAAAVAPTPKADPEALFAQAQKAQQEGNGRAAVALYKQAFNAGNGRAARSLAEIYGRGSGGVDRDYVESVQWSNKVKAAGIDMPIPGKRN